MQREGTRTYLFMGGRQNREPAQQITTRVYLELIFLNWPSRDSNPGPLLSTRTTSPQVYYSVRRYGNPIEVKWLENILLLFKTFIHDQKSPEYTRFERKLDNVFINRVSRKFNSVVYCQGRKEIVRFVLRTRLYIERFSAIYFDRAGADDIYLSDIPMTTLGDRMLSKC